MASPVSIKCTTDPVGIQITGLAWYAQAYSISGLGLETRGFVFLVDDIWTPANVAYPAVWVGCTSCVFCD